MSYFSLNKPFDGLFGVKTYVAIDKIILMVYT